MNAFALALRSSLLVSQKSDSHCTIILVGFCPYLFKGYSIDSTLTTFRSTMISKQSFTLALCICLAILSVVTPFAPAISHQRQIFSIQRMSETESTEPVNVEPEVRCPDCDKCDGSGRILGGIPRVLPWWPIKPYRPCPNFIANGGQYSRIGQPLDEIAFGRGGPVNDADDDDF
jgi:hypothetical protein